MVEGASGLCMPALLLFFDLDEGLTAMMSLGGLTAIEAPTILKYRLLDHAGGRLLDLPERGEKGGRKEKKEEKGEGKKGRKGRPLIFSSLN